MRSVEPITVDADADKFRTRICDKIERFGTSEQYEKPEHLVFNVSNLGIRFIWAFEISNHFFLFKRSIAFLAHGRQAMGCFAQLGRPRCGRPR